MGLLTRSSADLDDLDGLTVIAELVANDGQLLAGTWCACPNSMTLRKAGSVSLGVFGGTGQWSGSAEFRIGDGVHADWFTLRSQNRVRFYLLGTAGADQVRIPIGTLGVADFSATEEQIVQATMVGIESLLSNSRIPALIDLYPEADAGRWTAADAAYWLTSQADQNLLVNGDSTPRKLSTQVEQPAFAQSFEQGWTWWSAVLTTVAMYGGQPMFDRFGQFTILYPLNRSLIASRFTFDDSTMTDVEPIEDTFTPLGAVVSTDVAVAAEGDSSGSTWMARPGTVSPAFADSRDPEHSTWTAPTSAEFNLTGAIESELDMALEALADLFDPPEYIRFTTSKARLHDVGDVGWIRSDLRGIDSLFRIIEASWDYEAGGVNVTTSFKAQRVAE